jgi:hypothetical protein
MAMEDEPAAPAQQRLDLDMNSSPPPVARTADDAFGVSQLDLDLDSDFDNDDGTKNNGDAGASTDNKTKAPRKPRVTVKLDAEKYVGELL